MTEVQVGRADVVVKDRIKGEREKAVLNKVQKHVGWDGTSVTRKVGHTYPRPCSCHRTCVGHGVALSSPWP